MIFIDQTLRDGKPLTCQTLVREFGIDRKTALRDIDFLRDQLGAPIDFDKRLNTYHYTERGYFLPAVYMQEKDVAAFYIADKILKQYESAPYYRDLKYAFDKLLMYVPEPLTRDAAATIFAFEQPPSSPVEHEHFQALRRAAEARYSVRITYRAHSKRETTERIVNPYTLVNHHGDWYLIAYCHTRKDIRTFALSRILALTSVDSERDVEKFEIPDGFSIDAYLNESFELNRENRDYRIELKFTPYQAQWIRERTWHTSQTLRELPDGSLILSFTVRGLGDVKRWTLKYGAEVEVLAPKELRDAVADEVKKLAAVYAETQHRSD